MFKALLPAALLLTALPQNATAQSSLGFTAVSFSLEKGSGDFGVTRADLNADFAITDVHGLQIDLGASDAGPRWRGDLAAHLYMAPTERAKYGLFAAVGDTSHESQTSWAIGAEGIWAVGARGSVSARAGLGSVKPGSNDFVFARLSARYALSSRTALTASLAATDIDEFSYSARETTASLGLRHRIGDGPVTLSARIEHSAFSGSFASKDETRVVIGLTTRFGATGHGVRNQPFAPVRPLDGLFARGTFALD
ncbi:hypothetical protein [Thioclava pacifica]|uniref:Porin domain-containing protein n=1 Tax=Thioclava pacifica DSM 10166 TaxID=1353537 RepID=A0A074J7Z3_9RHOB|nr:hypothetical protein [Thioclava pacifica]KEO51718.1 hypothetical protein TP2_09575 [Thioclava pacifica DSM 10166]